jgi:WD40 repeat protein
MTKQFVAKLQGIFILSIVIVIFAITPYSSTVIGQSSSLPYIYYLADTLDSLVIERVDGGDSRILTELPDGNTLFTTFDWSPSGEWVAWLNGRWNGPGNVMLTPWIMRSDGNQQRHRLDEFNNTTFLQWSPTDDVLFVVDRLSLFSSRLMLLDVPSDTILAQFTYENVASVDYSHPPYTHYAWSSDGQYAYAVMGAQDTQTLITLSRNGAIKSHVFGETWAFKLEDFTRGRALYNVLRPEVDYQLRMIMQDVGSGKEVVLLTDDREVEGDAYWNASLTYALVQFRWRNEENRLVRTENYLLDWEHNSANPLPEMLSVRLTQDYVSLPYHLWSPNGQFAALVDPDENLHILNVETGDVHVLSIRNVTDWHWSTIDSSLVIQVAQETLSESISYRYEPESQKLARYPILDGRVYYWLQFSPDGSQLAALPNVTGTLMDMETGERIPLIHHSLAQAGMHTYGIVWHDSGDWYMTGEHIFYSGGGGGPEAMTLYSRDGTLRRELGECFGYTSCAGFVPERAVPFLGSGQPQSVVTEPLLTLKHDQPIEAVAWSPDGKLLATYGFARNSDEATLTIWMMTADQAQMVEEYSLSEVCNNHPGSCLMRWIDDTTIAIDNNYNTAFEFDLGMKEVQQIPEGEHEFHPEISQDGLYRADVRERKITIHDVLQGTVVWERALEESANTTFFISYWLPEGHTLLFQQFDRRIFRWDGSEVQEIGSGALMWGYAYHEQAQLLATGSLYSRVSLIDTKLGKRLTDLNWASSALAFNHDGSLLAAGGTELVTIWDTTRYRD